jgi:hypothetical protein
MPSLRQQLDELERATSIAGRYVDLCLILQRAKTGETLLWAGGRWDRLDRRFIDQEPESGKIIQLEESQVEFTRWFGGWLRDYREGLQRDTSIAFGAGERRGGKTFGFQACTIAATVDIPSLISWLVCRTFRERDELDRMLAELIPSHWYRHRKAPEFRYEWVHGSITRLLSAIDGESLKQGRADVVMLNDAQKMDIGAVSNALGGTIDRGGLALIAANPPQYVRGEWVLDLKEAIDDGRVAGCKFFGFSSALNSRIDQDARSRFKSILKALDPRAAEADAEGMWRPIGDAAYPNLKVREHDRSEIPGDDVTAQVTYKRLGLYFEHVGGADFQASPYHAGVFLHVYDQHRDDAKLTYHVVGQALREGTEDEFLDTVDDVGLWTPENTLWIGDASGTWQDGRHSLRGRVSFDVFKQRRWRIEAPQKKRTERGDHPRNPAREDRIALVNNLLAQGRLFIDGKACPDLLLGLKKCELKNGKPIGKHAHITDALGYALWWLEPRPKARTGVPKVGTVDIRPDRSNWY